MWSGVQGQAPDGVAHTAPAMSLKGIQLPRREAGPPNHHNDKVDSSKALSTLMRKLDADAATMQKLEPSIVKLAHSRARSHGVKAYTQTVKGSTSGSAVKVSAALQGYLAHKTSPPRRTLQ